MSNYLLDWSKAGLEGTFGVDGPNGTLDVRVGTGWHDSGDLRIEEKYGEKLIVSDPDDGKSTTCISFDEPVEGVSFKLYDVDEGQTWDDKVTVIARDADGNVLDVTFSDLNGQKVYGNTLKGEGDLQGGEHPVSVTVSGEVATLEIVHEDKGDCGDGSGKIGIGDISFDYGPALDGYVEGTNGDDVIDIDYTGDPEGDRIDHGDAILPGETGDDDIVLAGGGDDEIRSGDGNDEIYGGGGDDTLHGGTGDDVIYGDRTGPGAGERVTLDFEGFHSGEIVGNQYASMGVTISSGDGHHPAMIFDSEHPTGGDRDLGTGDLGNVLIVSEDGDSSDPDDNAHGGELRFDFDSPSSVHELTLLDIEESGGEIRLYDGDGELIREVAIPRDCDGGRQTLSIDTHGVSRMVVELAGSGAIDNVSFTPSGDEGGDNDDHLYGDEGHDTIYGGGGDDLIVGGADGDTLYGGDDSDHFIVDDHGHGIGDYVDGGSGGNDDDRLDLTGSGTFRIVDRTTDSDGNGYDGTVEWLDDDGDVTGRLEFDNIEEIIVCFTPGTAIATPMGERAVEELAPGDRVLTRDNGIQEIAWTGNKRLDRLDLSAAPHLQPVLIRKGALGQGLPERDMMVSPNHRVLVSSDRAALFFEEREVLVAAKHLVGQAGIERTLPERVSYIHFMFERHEVVLSDGAWTESFQPGDYTMQGLETSQRREILDLFPELESVKGMADYAAARRTLKRHEARLLAC